MLINDSNPVSRRRFLQSGAGGAAALIVGLYLPERARARSASAASGTSAGAMDAFAPNAFVRIAEDDTVTVMIKHIEFGQGPYTGLATLVAEELDADWSQMRAESAPANVELYANTLFGMQGTGGSTAMASSYDQMRRAGAVARSMLVAAAAKQWNVNAAEIRVDAGRITHADGHESGFGAMAARAASESAPSDPPLKDPADFKLIGTRLPKLDTRAKSTGAARYSLDVYRENMLTVVVRHPPVFGATVKSVDDAAARQVKGVVDVQRIPQGVAVYANTTYAALKGREALGVEWDTSKAETRSSAEMINVWRKAVQAPGTMADSKGDIDSPVSDEATSFQAEFVFPYLAHAPMETLDGVIEQGKNGVEVWIGSQMQTVDQQTIANVLDVKPEQVALNTLFAGGSFGRRAQPASNFAAELAAVAKAHAEGGGTAPVKLMWTRDDDIRGGYYRPLTVHRLSASIDKTGTITHWDNTVANQSIMAGTPFEAYIGKDGIDPSSIEGSRGLPYDIPNLRVSLHDMEAGVPVLWWRSVGHTHTAFATETFIDELLEAGGKDAIKGRRDLVGADPRHVGVLDAVAKASDWGSDVPEGRARGVALHKSFSTYVAQVVEVSRGKDSLPKVHKVWCAVDCGVAVNPDVITAQIEGGVGYALGAVLFNEVTLEPGGTIVQSNFDTYRSLRINEMPEVDVVIVKSAEAPTGIGEPGVPPLAPAVANAWRRLTGDSVRQLPMLAVQA